MTAARGRELGDAVAAVLRAAGGPLGARDIVDRLPPSMRSRAPAQVGNAAREHPLCMSARRGQYVYVPSAITGAAVFLPRLPAPRRVRRRVPLEALCLLWPEAPRFGFGPPCEQEPRPAELELPGGRHVLWQANTVEADGAMLDGDATVPSADGFLLRCLDGEAKRYAIVPCAAPTLAEAAEREARWLAVASELLTAGRVYPPQTLVLRLLAGGAYHHEPPYATLAALTARPPFVSEALAVSFRPDLTPAMWRLFEGRRPYWQRRPEETSPAPVVHGVTYRLRAHLHDGSWWVELEVAAEHSLEQLHAALQSALRWDNDHLYAFYLSGRHGDPLTAVPGPGARDRGPTAEDVTLGHFDPPVGSHFAYLFDFGDRWEFVVDVVARTASGPPRSRPRRLAVHGRPPEQYPESE